MELKLNIDYWQEGDYIVAYCPALNLSAFGETVQEAEESFTTTLRIFLDYTIHHNTLHKVLTELGWIQQKQLWLPPAIQTPGENVIWQKEETCFVAFTR